MSIFLKLEKLLLKFHLKMNEEWKQKFNETTFNIQYDTDDRWSINQDSNFVI